MRQKTKIPRFFKRGSCLIYAKAEGSFGVRRFFLFLFVLFFIGIVEEVFA